MKSPLIRPDVGALLFSQLASAARNGIPLADILGILRQDPTLYGRDAPVIDALADACSAVGSLSAAMGQLSAFFPTGTTALVAAGEKEGRLADTLEGLSADFERLGLARQGLRQALTWPLVLMGAAVLLMLLMFLFVIPAFKEVFTSFGADLPFVTLAVISLSDLTVAEPWLIILAVVFAVLWYHRRLPAAWLNKLDGIPLRAPILERYLTQRQVGRLLHWLGLAQDSPELRLAALQHLHDTTWQPQLRADIAGLAERLGAGAGLAEALGHLKVLPARLGLFGRLGEKTGSLAAFSLLGDITAQEEHEALKALQLGLLLTAYIVIGSILGVLVIAMYLPIFRLGSVV